MLVEMHMIKNFPPTNLNRDETGSPKSCFFGGAQRGRISSQSIKHAWRRDSEFSRMPLGIRTRYLPELIAKELANRNVDKEYMDIVKKKMTAFGNRERKENDDLITSQVMFFAKEDIIAVADEVEKTIRETGSPKKFEDIKVKQWQDVLKRQTRPVTMDMALFGRMITDDSFRDVEASLQVAHAISTHTVNQESDFFTAVDDLKMEYGEDAGSAMMGDTDYNSCCYYFYASLDTDQLINNIEKNEEAMEVLPDLLPLLLQAMAYTNPSGKQNTFAGHTYPSLICVERKMKKIPISYANAFEKPIRSSMGYTSPSIKALANTIDQFDQCYALPVEERLWFCPSEEAMPQNAVSVKTMPDLLKQVGLWLKEV